MIIGISGKIGSGKDLIGLIIQYLTYKGMWSEERGMSYSGFIDNYKSFLPTWKIKKFADKLKECTSLILGIPREDLEKIEVKNSKLGKEWIRYAYASGFTKDNNGETTMLSTDCDEERYNLELKINWQTAYKKELTVRDFLQQFGTNACRDQVHPNFWVNALFSEYKSYSQASKDLGVGKGFEFKDVFPNWIITDVRFPNELEAINKIGINIRINRKLFYWKDKEKSFSTTTGFVEHYDGLESDSKMNHPSETALDNANFDYTIDNNGTIEELIEKVKEILIKEKII